jgi:hypothetical protein
MADNNLINFVPGSKMSFSYTNHKGETRRRTIILESIGFGTTEWYPHYLGWYLNGLDLEKNLRRSFAIINIITHAEQG